MRRRPAGKAHFAHVTIAVRIQRHAMGAMNFPVTLPLISFSIF